MLAEELSKLNYNQAEFIAKELLEESPEYSQVKKLYIDCLLYNCKTQDCIFFIAKHINDQERKQPEFQYLICLSLYYNEN